MSAAIWLQCVKQRPSSLMSSCCGFQSSECEMVMGSPDSVEHLSAIVFRLCCEATAAAIRIV